MLKTRRSWDRFIFSMGIPILVRHTSLTEIASILHNVRLIFVRSPDGSFGKIVGHLCIRCMGVVWWAHCSIFVWALPVFLMIWVVTWVPFYWYGLTLISVWISNHMPSKVWDEIIHPFPDLNGATCNGWNYSSVLGIKLYHVSKRCPCFQNTVMHRIT